MNIDIHLLYLVPSACIGSAHVIRLWCRDRRDDQLARHVFDTTGDTQALDGYARLTAARNRRARRTSAGPPPPP